MQRMNVVALAGGVGGAKLATGLQKVLHPGELTVIVNTGDDFEHWGLAISPDIDTVLYNLAGINHPEQGWGRVEESFTTFQTMSQLGGEDWFRLGDRDLALHLRRTEWLRQGISLTEVTERLRRSLGIPSHILPMSDQPVRTLVHTDEGDLPFQHYFVRRRCEPIMIDLSFVGATETRMSEAIHRAIHAANVIVFCPSNPYLSLDPILSIPGIRHSLRAAAAPKVAVSPIISGSAVKGPAAKIMRELGLLSSPLTVFDRYDDLLTGFVLDQADSALADAIAVPTLVTTTMMTDLPSKTQLAEEVLTFAQRLSEQPERQRK